MKLLSSKIFKLVTVFAIVFTYLLTSSSIGYSDSFDENVVAGEVSSSDISSSEVITVTGDEETATEEAHAEEVVTEEAQSEDVAEMTQTEETVTEEVQTEEATEETQIEEIQAEEATVVPVTRGAIMRAAGIANVYDEATFIAALQDTKVTTINITDNFSLSQGNVLPVYTSYIRPELIINGNGYTVDFAGFCPVFYVSASKPMNLTLCNITIYGTNYYGPMMIDGTAGYGKIRYENVKYYGAQITASYNADLTFAGDIVCEQMTSYTSPINSVKRDTQATGQANFEATNLIIEANTRYVGRTVNSGAWWLYYGGTVMINEGAIVDLYAPGTGYEANGNTIYVQGSLIIKDGAQLNIHNDATATYARPAIQVVNSGSSVLVSSGAQLNIDINGNLTTRAGIYLSSGTSFIVEKGAALNMNLRNQGSSTYNAIYGEGNNTFKIGKKGTFDVRVDGTGARNIIYLAGSNNTFQFEDARRVNLQLDNTSSSSRLIYIAASQKSRLDVNIQKVSAWTSNTWTSGGDDNATFSWTPIYGMIATYSGANISSVVAGSLTTAVANDFTQKFKTINSSDSSAKRLLFEYIPDIEITLNSLTNDTAKSNSHTITGSTNPGAYILLSGNTYIPAGTIPGQADTDTKLYHTIADAQGNFSITLEDGYYFIAGETITAYAYLNGKDNSAATIVSDEVAPDPPVLDELQIGSTAFTGTAEANSTVNIYNKDGALVVTGTADGNGDFLILIPSEVTLASGDQYYAKAIDASNNESGASNLVGIYTSSLEFISAPTAISFGENIKISPFDRSYGMKAMDVKLAVRDTRLSKAAWRVTATLEAAFYNADKESTLENALVYVSGGNETILTYQKAVIYQCLSTNNDTINISDTWNDVSGLLLKVRAGTGRVGTYEGTIKWTLEDVPVN